MYKKIARSHSEVCWRQENARNRILKIVNRKKIHTFPLLSLWLEGLLPNIRQPQTGWYHQDHQQEVGNEEYNKAEYLKDTWD